MSISIKERAALIDPILLAYVSSKGAIERTGDIPDESKLHEIIARLMTDIRHWCDIQNIDFHTTINSSYEQYCLDLHECDDAATKPTPPLPFRDMEP